MKTISNIKTDSYVYNHIVYDNSTDKHFAKHSHAIYEMIYILNGEVEYIIEDRVYKGRKNDLIFIKPYTYHYFTIKSGANYEKIGILFTPPTIGLSDSDINQDIELVDCSSLPIIDSIFQKLPYYYASFSKDRFLEMYFPLVKELVYNLSLVKAPSISAQSHTPILTPILEYINANLFTIKTLDEISSALNISTSYLKGIFKKELKTQPKKYINEKRILTARQLILLGEKAGDVSARCGFENYSTFYRLYCSYFGFSPSGNNDIVAT